jgi:hypothetical protein
VSWSIQDHVDAGLGLLRADSGLTVYDGAVPKSPADHYVLLYTYRELPTGLIAPQKIKLTGKSTVVNMWMYCHCIGTDAITSRAIQGRVQAALLDQTPVVAGRTCWPIRWVEGTQAQRDETTGPLVIDNVDVYAWSSIAPG